MTKEEKREIIKDSFTIAMGLACILSFISSILLGIIWIIIDSNRREHSIFYLLFAPLIMLILWFIGVLILNYIAISKKKKEKEKNIEYINSIFSSQDSLLVMPKCRDYQSFFETLSLIHDIKFIAKMNDEKILIFMIIDKEERIKFEEINKEDFFEYYELY